MNEHVTRIAIAKQKEIDRKLPCRGSRRSWYFRDCERNSVESMSKDTYTPDSRSDMHFQFISSCIEYGWVPNVHVEVESNMETVTVNVFYYHPVTHLLGVCLYFVFPDTMLES